MMCEKVKKLENKHEAASTLLGSERPFGQVHLLWQILFDLDEEEVESDDDETEAESNEEGKDTGDDDEDEDGDT